MTDANKNRAGKPGRKGITYEQYREAYEAVVAEGKILCPSNEVMRAKLGGCAEEKLCAFKRRYQDEQSAKLIDQYKLTPELQLAVARQIHGLAAKTNESIAAELESNRKDMDALLERIDALLNENSNIENQRLEMQLENSRLEGVAQQLRDDNAQMRVSLDDAQQKIVDLTSEINAKKVRDEFHGGLYRLSLGEMQQTS